MNGILTVEQIATRLNVCDETIYRLLRSRQLPGFKVNSLWRITEEDLANYIKGKGQNTRDTEKR